MTYKDNYTTVRGLQKESSVTIYNRRVNQFKNAIL